MSLEALPGAPAGSVTNLGPLWNLPDIGSTDAVLCRNNAPLVNVAFRLVKNQIPCKYLGKNLKDSMENLVKRFPASDPKAFLQRLIVYRDREVKRLHTKRKPRAAANLADMCDCLITIVEQCKTMTEVSAVIDKIFGTAGVTLSTIHKAKGLEWEKVWLLDRNLIPSPYSTNELARRQEANLLHVAITRTKLHLVYINSQSFD